MKTNTLFALLFVLLLSSSTFASDKTDLNNDNKIQKRSLASEEKQPDVDTPYTPAYLEKIDSADHNSDPEYVEDSRMDRER